ncbi:MAG TPA: penicillin-binding transpeptidase domain-containing protein [Verrucomicrobiae bacterium]|nr:penicillin-binding transpeptidase domain-containing protein [Verrucomicrobiae bacterium]
MIDRAMARVAALFVLAFLALAARQAYVQIVQAPSLSARADDPRHALTDAQRGRILATDGTVLAQTRNGKRIYPYGASLAHTLGYVSARYGTSGLEDAYDRALTPPQGSGDPIAQFQALLSAFGAGHGDARGADVVTTIVPAIQAELYAQLDRHVRAAGVVLDPNTGAVLAIASVPSFDPNTLDVNFSSLLSDPNSPLLDRALDGLYPPGSTFKIFTASAAVDSGTVAMDSRFHDPGYLDVGTFRLHNDEDEYTGDADLTTAFALSSNVDFAQIALKLGVDTFYQYLDRWNIGGSLDFQIPASRARVPDRNGLTDGELAQMGFGQGALLMTPLQMALIDATIAGGGNEPRPFIVRQIVRQGAISSVDAPGILTNPISADTATDVKNMMVAVVARGTGFPARIPGIVVAGKTGTATNPLGASHSWFVCFAPAGKPRVAVAIVVENAGYGASVAAPIARDVLETALQNVGT